MKKIVTSLFAVLLIFSLVGCNQKLTKLYLEDGRGSVNGAKVENVIVLLTNFDVDDSGDNPVLNADSTYEDYQWVLIRDDKTSEWKIDDSGY